MKTDRLVYVVAAAITLSGMGTGASAEDNDARSGESRIPNWVESAAKLYVNGHTSAVEFMDVMTVAVAAKEGDVDPMPTRAPVPMRKVSGPVKVISVPDSTTQHHHEAIPTSATRGSRRC